MKHFLLLSVVLMGCNQQPFNNKPNIIYILADDLGYGELGVYGQEIIETPHIDALANDGMLFTDHYSGSPVCAPSRSVFMTGQHTGHTPIRGNDEWKERGDTWNYQAMFDEAFLSFPPNKVLMISHQYLLDF